MVNDVQQPARAGNSSGVQRNRLDDALVRQTMDSLNLPVVLLKHNGQICYANAAFQSRVLAVSTQTTDITLDSASEPVFFDAILRESFQSVTADFRHRLSQSAPFSLRLADSTGEDVWQLNFGASIDGMRLAVMHCRSGAGDLSVVQDCDSELDVLTGLGNRKRLMRLIDELMPQADARQRAVMVIDLDHFKRINDTLGHALGDRLLQLVAARLKRAIRPSDPVMRLHGDEFIVLLEGEIDANRSVALGERIVDLMSRTFLVSGQQVEVGASVGVALADPQTLLWADLVRQADLALLSAKQAGRACVKVFTPVLERDAKHRRQMELALKKALVQNEFSLVYQPQVALATGEITGFEALLRWHHPELGDVDPETFIPLAESMGEIHTIGQWVLAQACEQALQWPSNLTIAVNVSPLQIAAQDFSRKVADILSRVGLSPHRLEIEITEKMLIEPSAEPQIKALSEMGIGIALDDFGAGYSALSYLNLYRFSKIKLDQGFFRRPAEQVCESMMKILISLGHALSVPVVAEGVESLAVCDALRRQGCTAVQGFLISKPVRPNLIPQLFQDHHMAAGGVLSCEE